jgi:hypothetical protein
MANDLTPSYLTNHGDACEEIGALATLLAQMLTLTEQVTGDPTLLAVLANLANAATEHESVARALARGYGADCTLCMAAHA